MTTDGTITVEWPKADEIRAEYYAIVDVREISVIDIETHRIAQERLIALAMAEKRVNDRLGPIIQHAHRAHKELTELRSDLLRPIAQAKMLLTGKIVEYETEERRCAEEKAREFAARARVTEEERVLLDAIDAEQRGDKAVAEQILGEPVRVPTITVEAELAKVEGVSSRITWHAEVTDLFALIRYVAEHEEWISLLDANASALKDRCIAATATDSQSSASPHHLLKH